MRYIEKTIGGYATSYGSTSQYSSSYSWSNTAKAFDWDSTISPSTTGNDKWWNTYATVKVATYTSASWNVSGITNFKSCLDDNFNDAYDGNGTIYTNFNCLPSGTEIKQIAFATKTSMPTYGKELVYFNKGSDPVLANTNGNISSSYALIYRQTSSSGSSVSALGINWKKTSNGKFYANGDENNYSIGTWTLDEIQSGLFKPKVEFKRVSGASGSSYWYPRGFGLELIVDIPAYELVVSPSIVDGGTISGAGEYFSGKYAKLVATANPGYRFVNWTYPDGALMWTEPTLDLLMDNDYQLIAVFEPDGINNVYGNTSKLLKAYVDTNNVKAIYVDKTKVYG